MAAAVNRTVTQLIQQSLQIINVLAAGETADTNDLDDCLMSFQDMVAELASDNLFIPFITESAIPLTADVGEYTIGEDDTGSPDSSAARPEEIIEAFVRDSGKTDTPLRMMGLRDFTGLSAKYSTNFSSGRPEFLWYNPTSPNGTIYLEPWPTSSYEYLYIYYAAPILEPVSLSLDLADDYFIPRNYHNALKWMLSIEVCPLFSREPSAVMVSKAASGYSRIVGLNALRRLQPAQLDCPGGSINCPTTIFNS